MKATDRSSRRRWLVGGVGGLVLATVVALFAFGVPEPQNGCGGTVAETPAITSSGLSFNSYGRVAAHPKNPVVACRAGGGTCVGLEDGACARGPIGDANAFSCGDAALRCCLPEGRYGAVGQARKGGSYAP